MPYPADHKPKTRGKILGSAAELFSRQGYDQVSIDQLMSHAGLTRGAFYSHFPDKQTLYAEAISFAARSSFRQRLSQADERSVADMFASYLSRAHIEDEQRCPLAFLVTDIAQRDDPVRNAYTRVFSRLVRQIQHANESTAGSARRSALAASTLAIGAVAIANTLSNEELGNELMEACRKHALQILEAEEGE